MTTDGTHTPDDFRRTLRQNIYDVVCKNCQTEKGVHIETALSALGALAGFGCQIATRDGLVKTGRIAEAEAFTVVDTAEGGKYYFGEMLNQPLFQTQVSVYSLIGGGIQRAGSADFPDVAAIAEHVAATVGTEAFGILTVPAEHQPLLSPMDNLKRFWPPFYEQISAFYGELFDPMHFGWIFAEAAQELIVNSKDIIEPGLAGHIAFESAMAMSKVDPATIGHKGI